MTAAAAISSGHGDDADGVDRTVRQLVFANKARLFPGTDDVEILDVELGPPRNARWGSHHRALRVNYGRAGRFGTLGLWVKFRPGLDALFPLLEAYDRGIARPIFPEPVFSGPSIDTLPPFLATRRIDGALLRDRLLHLAALRRTSALKPVFRSNGAKMRAFHDVFPAEDQTPVADVVRRLCGLVETAPQLDAAERAAIAAQVELAGDRLGVTALPTVRTHDDWVLRNIIVTPDGDDYVIDTAGLGGAPRWRWYDLALLQLNLEFQLKWSPLTTWRMLGGLWQAFWQGYFGEDGPPDGLVPAQVVPLLYLVRLDWLLGGVVRQPYLDLVTGRGMLNARVGRRLRAALAAGRCTVLDC